MAVDPGVLNTQLARNYLLTELQLLPAFLRPLLRPVWQAAIPWLLLPPEVAAENNLYAATAPADEVTPYAVLCMGGLKECPRMGL